MRVLRNNAFYHALGATREQPPQRATAAAARPAGVPSGVSSGVPSEAATSPGVRTPSERARSIETWIPEVASPASHPLPTGPRASLTGSDPFGRGSDGAGGGGAAAGRRRVPDRPPSDRHALPGFVQDADSRMPAPGFSANMR
jgi:hypothetical protein